MTDKVRNRTEKKRSNLNRVILECANNILRETGAAAVLLFVDAIEEWELWKRFGAKKHLILITQDPDTASRVEAVKKEFRAVIKLPAVKLTRLSEIKLSTVLSITSGIIKETDRVICISGMKSKGELDMLVVIDLSTETELVSTAGITKELLKHVRPMLLETVLNLALEIASEGREGKPVGATFVIGDYENVSRFTRPLIMNPFRGYPEDARNILDPSLHETIKEFALLDGAIIIREDGIVEAAGVHLDASLKKEGVLPGLGSRHMSAAGITDVTDAVAITVSGSTGAVRVFREGKIALDIERSKPQAGQITL